ncbi:putative oxidoreductase CzcO [Corynebacterium kalinowskii]|uniref:Oxidoreductase CzcO n=1 Tax=Corynebacterium kalinowskii TaxID=2675216 RepID=A0A6B8VQ83_9CORY|nr:NAD(P)-binding domain-containing protein [Corynebacterium kalinowskii]QGU01185.1 putative oxidoreductase CzcO [Corynebacterium kalinowskii]
MSHFQVVVIGAGQAGLSTGQQLTHLGLTPGTDFLILDANDGPGGAWRHRWDSLTLGAAHGIADLPGLPAPGGDDATPASTVVADYYGSYEEQFQLAVRRPANVTKVEQDRIFTITLDSGDTLTADIIISATGTWDSPYIPYFPGIDSFQGQQLHTKDYTRAEDFAGKRTLVVGGGLSAVQFLLELEHVTETLWATRRPPDFGVEKQSARWGLDVERRVRERIASGEPPASVVASTGIPARPDYSAGVDRGVLVSRGMFNRVLHDAVVFGEPVAQAKYGWDPLPAGTIESVDVIFWNTGFRHSLAHLAPLKLRNGKGGIDMLDEVRVARNPRVLLAGYGSTASTVGATRAGRRAARAAVELLQNTTN